MTIQMKATEQYFPDKSYGVTVQMRTTKRYFPVVHFIVLQTIAPSVNPTKESNRFVYCTATARGDLAKTLLVDARQPELDFSNSWAILSPDFRANRLY